MNICGVRKNKCMSRKYLLLPIVISVLLLSFVYINLRENRNQIIIDKLDEEAIKLVGFLRSDLRGRMPAFKRMAKRWRIHKGLTEEEFALEAQAYISDLGGVKQIEALDDKFELLWRVSYLSDGNLLQEGKDFSYKDDPVLKKSIEENELGMTSVLDFGPKGMGIKIYFPVFREQKLEVVLVAVFLLSDWIKYVFHVDEDISLVEDDVVYVYADDKLIYKKVSEDVSPDFTRMSAAESNILEHKFLVKVFPTASFVAKNTDAFPEMFLSIGGIFSLLFIFVAYLFQKASYSACQTKQANKKLLEEIAVRKEIEEKLHLAAEAGQIGIWTYNAKDNSLIWNDIMYSLYNISKTKDKLDYTDWSSKVVAADLSAAEKKLKDSLENGQLFDTEFRINYTDQIVKTIKVMAQPERDEGGNVTTITGVNWDISAVKEAREKMEYIANHDTLTGLPSLRMVKDSANIAFSLARRHKKLIAVMFLDLDEFKPINDTYGHDIGDLVLQEVADRFTSVLRESDTVGRIGGDEFIFILNDIDCQLDAEKVAKKIIAEISKPLLIKQHTLHVGVSIGIAFYPGDGSDVEELLKCADKAMYAVKKSGKNSYAYA